MLTQDALGIILSGSTLIFADLIAYNFAKVQRIQTFKTIICSNF